jgi:hypothetical protein
MATLKEDVLTAIAHDYEPIDQILLDVRAWHPTTTINHEEVVTALQELVHCELANAYELSTTEPARLVEFKPTRAKDLYFYMSPKGKQALSR